MANLPESATWEAGITQLETTDPVVGGANGKSNEPLKKLANRTVFLKAITDLLGTAAFKNVGEAVDNVIVKGGFGLGKGKQFSDFNAILEAGFYVSSGSLSNAPGGDSYFVIADNDDTNNLIQLAVGKVTLSLHVRSRNSATWSAWRRLDSSSESKTGDLNDIKTAGNYVVSNTQTNFPSSTLYPGLTSGFLQVIETSSGTYVRQIFTDIESDLVLSRYYISSAWSQWISQNGTPGEVAAFARNTAPAGWIACSGQAVSRTTYSRLFAAIGTTFGAGDGSTTFTLPDLRGEFIRGWDNGRNIDTGRTLGSYQADDFKSHTHGYKVDGSGQSGSGGYGANPAGGINATTQATGGTETRPRNIALLYCIKF